MDSEKNPEKYRLGLVLGGGGARGFAHLGILKAFEEKGIKPDIIAGVSAGAIAGTLYADGKSPEAIHQIIKSKGVFDYTRPNLFAGGFLKLDGLREQLKKNLSVDRIEDLETDFIIAATCLQSGLVEFVEEGPLAEWIIASSSVPVLFEPMKIGEKLYVDGGLSTNFPIEPLIERCEKIIGVNISPLSNEGRLKSVWEIASRSFEVSINSDLKTLSTYCDLYIKPEGIGNYGLFDLRKADEIFELGYESAVKSLQESELDLVTS